MDHSEMLRCMYQIFHPSLPRLGPGDKQSTARAIQAVRPCLTHAPLRIIDLGSGNGAQTLCLAEALPGVITAVESHAPFLEELSRRAAAAGLTAKITPLCADMNALDLPPASFDLVWSEGALYNAGLDAGLQLGYRLLKEGGCMAFTELNWLSGKRSQPCVDFFAGEGLEVIDIPANLSHIQAAGFRLLEHFALPDSSWWTDFYRPLTQRLAGMVKEAAADANLQTLIKRIEMEIEIFRGYADEYGYVFYIMQK